MAWWIFQNLVTTAALAATVAIVCRFARIGPVARHALWVLVLVKFITPPLVVWPWSAPDPLGIAKFDALVIDRPVETARPAGAIGEAANVAVATLPIDLDASTSVTASPRPIQNDGKSVWSWVVGLWIAGSICLLGIELVRLTRLARQVRHGASPGPAIRRRVKELARQLGVKPVRVVTVAGISSPVVWCLGEPRLLWPTALSLDPQTPDSLDSRTDSGLRTDAGLRTDTGSRTDSGPWTPDSGLTNASLDGLLVHELAHIKRRDHIVGWIELVAGLVWWWNPLFWSVRSALREQAELACDAWVISALPNGRRAYAESLLALSSLGAAPSPSMAAVVGVRASSRRVLERRLVMIMKGRAPLRLPSAGLLTLAVMAVATLPAWATGTTEDRQQQPQAAQQSAQPVQPSQQPAQAAQTVQATQAPAQPQAQQGQTKPAPTTTTAKPSPQAPAITHTITATPVHTPTPTTHAIVVTKPAHAAPVTAQVQPTRKVVTVDGQDWKARRSFFPESSQLTDEGQKIVASLEAEREAIQKEADAKIEAKRQATIKQLEALQDQYAKAGKLDEAVAIRDYLKAGGPGNQKFSWIIKRNP